MTVQVEVCAGDGLLHAVRALVAEADEALLCVAFANQAGVNLVAPALASARERVRLLSTTVFGQTTAGALQRAADLGTDVRVLNLPRGTYHPKLYLARRGDEVRALVGSANLTSGLLRNVEVAAALAGRAEDAALRDLEALAEGWWRHPLAEPWSPAVPAPAGDVFPEDLWEPLRGAIAPGMTIRTVDRGHPNRIVEVTRSGLWIETDRSRDLGRGAELVPAWMFTIAWDYLVAHRQLTNQHLLATDGLNVKRSSAVCAVLAQLPQVEVARRRPITLRHIKTEASQAADDAADYRPRPDRG